MTFDPVFLAQHAIDPEAVENRLLDHDDGKILPRARPRFLAELGKACKQSGDIAAGNRVLRHLLTATWPRRCDQPGRLAQFH